MSLHNPRARIRIGEETFIGSKTSKPRIVAGDSTLFDSFTHKSLFVKLSVELTTNKASQAEFTVVDKDFAFIDSYTRDDGVLPCAASVYFGYGEEMGTPVFEGLLAAVEHDNGQSKLCFYDRSLRMKLEEKTGYHKGLDIDVMKALAGRNGLSFELLDKSVKGLPLKSSRQEAVTDWDFLMDLAREAGLVVWVRGSTLYAARPARVGEPVLTLKGRGSLLLKGERFRYETPENVEGSVASVEVRYRGKGGKRGSALSAQRKRGRKKIVISDSVRELSHSEAKRRAQAIQDMESEPSFNASVETLFHPETRKIEVRNTVRLVNRGGLFSGLYLVDAVHMDFSPGNLTMGFALVRDALTCKELMAIPNAQEIYPAAYKRCQERPRRVTS